MGELPKSGVVLVAEDAGRFKRDMEAAKKEVAGIGTASTQASKGLGTFSSQLSSVTGSLKQMVSGDIVGGLQGIVSSMGPMGVAVGAVAGSIAAIGYAINQVTERIRTHINSVDDLSDRYSLTTSKAEELLNVSQIFGIEVNTLARTFRTLSDKGIEPSLDGLRQVKDYLDTIEDPTRRTNEAFRLLGKGAITMADFLATGNAELDKWTQLAREASTVTSSMTDAQDTFNRQMNAYKLQGEAASTVMSRNLLLQRQGTQLSLQDIGLKIKLHDALMAAGVSTSYFTTATEDMWKQLVAVNEQQLLGIAVTQASTDAWLLLSDAERQARLEAEGIGKGLGTILDGMEELPPAVERVAAAIPKIPSIWDTVFPDPAELASKIAEQIAFVKAGGPALVAALEEIQTAMRGGDLTPEEAMPMLDEIQEAALSIPVAAGDMSKWDAAKQNAEDFGGSINQAKLDILAAGKAIADIPRSITIRVQLLGLAGYQHGGSFTVGGRAGADANMVAFRATRGERVTITPPGGSGGSTTNNNNNQAVNIGNVLNTGIPEGIFDRAMRDWLGA